MEIWRDVMNFDGVFAEAYMVNSEGELWSKDRVITCKNGAKRRWKGQRMMPNWANGYLLCRLQYNGYDEYIKLHQLIAFNFPEICGEWFPGAEVDHKDGNPLNNNPLNLSYKDHKANMNNPITKERRSKALKGKLTNRKDLSKPVVQLTMDGTFLHEFPSINEAARQTGAFGTLITRCCKGKLNSTGGYRWLYKSDYEQLKEAC